MEYRDTETLEVWDAATLLHHEDAATVQRQREVNADLAAEFDDIERTIESMLEDGRITDETAANQLTSELADLRETIVTVQAEDVEAVLDDRKLIVLDDAYRNDDRRIGWIVERVADVRAITRDQLDDSIGGDGVYGAIHDTPVNTAEDDTDDTDETNAATEDDADDETVDTTDLTVWVDPQVILNNAV